MYRLRVFFLVALLVTAGYLGFDSSRRRLVMLPILVVSIGFPEPSTRDAEGADTEWFDEYYTLTRADLEDLHDTLRRMKNNQLDGKGWWPLEYPVNDRLWLLADFEWAQQWD